MRVNTLVLRFRPQPATNAYRSLRGNVRWRSIYGASDSQAAYVKSNPVSTADICATIYTALGISPEFRVPDRTNRPVEIAHGGQPIREILA